MIDGALFATFNTFHIFSLLLLSKIAVFCKMFFRDVDVYERVWTRWQMFS